MSTDYISEETLFSILHAEQGRIMREYLKEFSRNELLEIKRLIKRLSRTEQ